MHLLNYILPPILALSILLGVYACRQDLGGDSKLSADTTTSVNLTLENITSSTTSTTTSSTTSTSTTTATTTSADTDDATAYNPTIDPNDFVEVVDNDLFNLASERIWEYEDTDEEGEIEEIEMEVIEESKTIQGVTMTVLRKRVWEHGESDPIEDNRLWYAQDTEGNVWWFGELVSNYEEGVFVDNEGSWEAGVDGAKPGIIMRANPVVGEQYYLAFIEGDTEDLIEVLELEKSITTRAGSYSNCLKVKKFSPLETDVTEQFFCTDAGNLVFEENVEGPSESGELVEVR